MGDPSAARPSGRHLRPIGREAEVTVLRELVGALERGPGRSLLVRGEPGIGKTMLLDDLLDGVLDCPPCAEGDSRPVVLRAAGVQCEADIAFAGLSDLLTPALENVDTLPAPQAAALAGALAIGPPRPGDRLAVNVAAVGLLRAAAEQRPVLAVVDDLQWLDQPSRECVLFVARRAPPGVAFVLAARDDPASPVESADLPTLGLRRLGEPASLRVLRRHYPDLSAQVARSLVQAADGNPLALVELPGTLTTDQRSGACEIVVPPDPGTRWRSLYATRIALLAETGRRALLVAALYQGDDLATLGRACLATGTRLDHLDSAEELGLVSLHRGHLSFAHPLIRGVVDHEASGPERRRVHRALARTVVGEARAWHLAASVVGPDEPVAAALERAAWGAAGRRGFASAVATLERAAGLSPDQTQRGRRLLSAGQTAAAAGMPSRAMALLDEALTTPIAQEERDQIQHARGTLLLWTGEVRLAGDLLRDEAEPMIARDPVRAATMLVDVAVARTASNDCVDAERLACRAAHVLGGDGDALARAHVYAVLGWVLALRGRPGRATAALAVAARHAADLDPLVPGRPWLNFVLRARVPQGELGAARADGVALSDRARDEGAVSVLAATLVVTADAAFRLGDWSRAESAATEAIEVSRDSNQQIWHGCAQVILAALAAARGDDVLSRRCVSAASEIASSAPARAGLRFCHGVRGFLALTFERIPEAISALESTERLVTGSGLEEPTLVPWPSDLIEAYVRAGETGPARRVLSSLTRRASGGPATARLLLHRSEGLVLEEFDAPFVAALACADECPMPFERARTLLAYGQRLHRARRRGEARVRLRDALDGFELVGAAPWAEQARRELSAAGARRRTAVRDEAALSTQEWRVARAVCRGASNKEVAAALFLSPKTVEFHLDHIYRKLGIHSRTCLAAALGKAVPAGPPQPRGAS